MLGWILLGLATVAVGVIIISGIVTESRIKEKMRELGIKMAMITMIDKCTNTVKLEEFCSEKTIEKCTNTVKLEEFCSEKTIEIRGDALDCELDEYTTIFA